MGQLCDDHCIAIFDEKKLHIYKKDDIIIQTTKDPLLTGLRNHIDGLWDVPFLQHDLKQLSTKSNLQLNYIIRKDKSKLELARYLHACAFSPVLSTFTKAIKRGNFVTWPGIEDLNFEKMLGAVKESEQDHLDQERKHLQSTSISKTTSSPTSTDTEDEFAPAPESTKTYNYFCKVIDNTATQKAYSDQTGCFPYQSS